MSTPLSLDSYYDYVQSYCAQDEDMTQAHKQDPTNQALLNRLFENTWLRFAKNSKESLDLSSSSFRSSLTFFCGRQPLTVKAPVKVKWGSKVDWMVPGEERTV